MGVLKNVKFQTIPLGLGLGLGLGLRLGLGLGLRSLGILRRVRFRVRVRVRVRVRRQVRLNAVTVFPKNNIWRHLLNNKYVFWQMYLASPPTFNMQVV